MADQLRGEIDTLIGKQRKAEVETLKSYELYETWKNKNDEFEAEFYYECYQTWSDETHRLGEKVQIKLKAVQKYESRRKMKEPRINDKKKEYMKYGPSDEEEWLADRFNIGI